MMLRPGLTEEQAVLSFRAIAFAAFSEVEPLAKFCGCTPEEAAMLKRQARHDFDVLMIRLKQARNAS